MKKLLFTAFAASLLLSSCSKTFYQVYKTEVPGLVESDNALVYENEDCKVIYNLWAENGNPGFVMHNKTDNDLYVMLPQTFLIKNGVALDYFKNREYRGSQAVTSSANILGSWHNAYKSVQGSNIIDKSVSTTIARKENPVVCIPPHASKVISEYVILNKLIRNCENKQAYPKTKSVPIEFTKEDTPLNFINRITYSFDKDGTISKSIENEFWISELINYSSKEAGFKETVKDCDSDDIGIKVYRFKVSAPGKFYNSYRGTSAGRNKSNNKGKLVL